MSVRRSLILLATLSFNLNCVRVERASSGVISQQCLELFREKLSEDAGSSIAICSHFRLEPMIVQADSWLRYQVESSGVNPRPNCLGSR